MGWTTEVLWFDSQQMYETVLFSKPFQLAVQSTQPHVKWVLGLFPRGISGQGMKMCTHVCMVSRLRINGTICHSLMCVHGVHGDSFTFTADFVGVLWCGNKVVWYSAH